VACVYMFSHLSLFLPCLSVCEWLQRPALLLASEQLLEFANSR